MDNEDIYEWDETTQTYMWVSNQLIEEQGIKEYEQEYIRQTRGE